MKIDTLLNKETKPPKIDITKWTPVTLSFVQ